MLIIEDDPETLKKLKRLYHDIFIAAGYDSVGIEECDSAKEAKQSARENASNPYDLVSIDVVLGDRNMTGLDILGAFRRFKSAWMAVLLTGLETDAKTEETLGKEETGKLRRQLRRRAHERFPAERLLVVEKPSTNEPSHVQENVLANKLRDIAGVFQAVSRQRYVFRPIEVDALKHIQGKKDKETKQITQEGTFEPYRSLYWQVRFDCGEMRTVRHQVGYKSLHKLLSLSRAESVTPEELRVIEPPEPAKKDRPQAAMKTDGDAVAAFFTKQGIEWESLDETARNKLVSVALAFRFKRFVELRGFEDDEDITTEEKSELDQIESELGPLAPLAETAYQRLKPDSDDIVDPAEVAHLSGELHTERDVYERRQGGKRKDSKAAQGFRRRFDRVANHLRKEGFPEMASHIEAYIMSTGANWSYNPPGEIEWTV